MGDNIEISTYHNVLDGGMTLAVKLSSSQMMAQYFERALIDRIVDRIAEKYVEENYAALVAKLDQQAIANLAIAQSGKDIAKQIHERPIVMQPDGERTTVNNFSLF